MGTSLNYQGLESWKSKSQEFMILCTSARPVEEQVQLDLERAG